MSNKPALNDEKNLKDYILDKLDISENDFYKILQDKNQNFKKPILINRLESLFIRKLICFLILVIF